MEHNEQERAENVAEAVKALLHIQDLAMAADPPDFEAAIAALTEANEISGFHVQRVEATLEVTHRDETRKKLSPEELKEAVQLLELEKLWGPTTD